MFWKREKTAQALTKAAKEFAFVHANQAGATRRATSMIPVAASGSHEIAHTSSVRYHQLLISLEGNQRTGCLRIISPKRKSRSAILIYKGRVVGCLYGCKSMDFQYLQQDAHRYALADLASPGNVLDAYELPEELVLAAAALFNGDILPIENQLHSQEMLEHAVGTLSRMQLPGCAVVSTADEEMVCMIYVFGGRVIGVFSAKDGWVKPTYETALSFVKDKPVRVQASYLPENNPEAAGLGFSLTGLADIQPNRRKEMTAQQEKAVDSLLSINEPKTYSKMEPVIPKPVRPAKTPRFTNDAISSVRSHNVFAICP